MYTMLGVVLGLQKRKQEDPKQCWSAEGSHSNVGPEQLTPDKASPTARIRTGVVTFLGLNIVIREGHPGVVNI